MTQDDGTIRLLISYKGTKFHGWQIQPDARTIEGELTAAVATLQGERIKVQGASRTDAGVHALGQVAHFRELIRRPVSVYYKALNHLTPKDIAVVSVDRVGRDFNARHSARGKIYRYRIVDGFHVHPLSQGQAWHVHHHLDVDAMNAAASLFVGTHDFACLQATGCQANGTVRTLRRVSVERLDNHEIVVTVEGSAFLRYMVRNLTGTLVEVGRGARPPEWAASVISARTRSLAGMTAPAKGLTLHRVLYPLHPMDAARRFW